MDDGTDDGTDGSASFRPRRPLHIVTSLNPMPNAQVCVFDGTYYKITTTNYISKTSLNTTFCMYPSGPWPLKIFNVCTACDP